VTSFAAAERHRLCDLALEVGPDAPTLSGDWTVRDLVAHLLVREGHPAALGIVLSPLASVLERAQNRVGARDFAGSVDRLRHGPPLLSPFAVPVLGDLANLAEYAVHHEDVRRAQPGWQPRELSRREQDVVWRLVRTAGRGLGVRSPVGVVAERTDVPGGRVRLRRTPGTTGDVLVRGEPLEVLLLLYGRQAHSVVELDGDAADVSALCGADLGI
jgi:uncharacterized protein (TIGR03085 family)